MTVSNRNSGQIEVLSHVLGGQTHDEFSRSVCDQRTTQAAVAEPWRDGGGRSLIAHNPGWGLVFEATHSKRAGRTEVQEAVR
jgi:hypothetical protein